MIRIRKAEDRGRFDLGWLQTSHTFSFGEYYDPQHNGFRSLRVMNEDVVQPGQGFGMHPHRDMEIVTIVLSGGLEHRDSLGHGEVLRPGELQRMSAGTGIRHSEFNPSETESVHLYQIWLHPSQKGLPPSYEQRAIDPAQRAGRWQLVASHDGRDGALKINQAAELWMAQLNAGTALTRDLAVDRGAWVQVLSGEVELNGQRMTAGDGAAIESEPLLSFHASHTAELLLFDLE